MMLQDESLICITIDVDWAAPSVVEDMVRLLDEAGIRATIFCTHEGIGVPGHERGLHPNFRLSGDSMRKLREEAGEKFFELSEAAVYEYVVGLTKTFCPEAVGVRAHSLLYDSQLLQIYRMAGLQYESNYLLPLAAGLRPVWKEYDLLEIPIFFNDHFELKSGATGFRLDAMHLERPGLKVFQFHPNMVFINAATDRQYLDCKACYHDYDRLLGLRSGGKGARTCFNELIDLITGKQLDTATLGEVNTSWRTSGKGFGV